VAAPPSPYAPGIISEERLPPQPAGRVSVFLFATFAMTVATSELYRYWLGSSALMTGHASSVGVASALISLPGVTIWLWAYLSDRVGLLGRRREGYLLLAGLMMAIVWLVLAFASQYIIVWTATALATGLATSVSRAAILGALAEIGQRRATTGGLAAVQVGVAQLAGIAMLPAGYYLLSDSIRWSAGVAAGLMLALALFIAVLWDAEPPVSSPKVASPSLVTIPAFLRSRAFWASVVLLAFAGMATVPDLVMARTLSTQEFGAFREGSLWLTPAITIGAASVYLLVCRRLRFGLLLRFALLAKAIALVVHALAPHVIGQALPPSVPMARAAGDGLTKIALLDLALRAAPRGREAFGAILLAGVPSIVALPAGLIESALGISASSAAWFGTGAAIAATGAVSLLAREIGWAREGRLAPEAPMLGSPS